MRHRIDVQSWPGKGSMFSLHLLPAGAAALTRRQLQILNLMAQGMQNKDIATELDTLEGTVKVHVRNVPQKLGVNNRTHAVVKAIHTGLVSAGTELPQDDRQD